jgi:hypothetical protein
MTLQYTNERGPMKQRHHMGALSVWNSLLRRITIRKRQGVFLLTPQKAVFTRWTVPAIKQARRLAADRMIESVVYAVGADVI